MSLPPGVPNLPRSPQPLVGREREQAVLTGRGSLVLISDTMGGDCHPLCWPGSPAAAWQPG
jgi:hypothetical protein